jgi:hypothetical protein
MLVADRRTERKIVSHGRETVGEMISDGVGHHKSDQPTIHNPDQEQHCDTSHRNPHSAMKPSDVRNQFPTEQSEEQTGGHHHRSLAHSEVIGDGLQLLIQQRNEGIDR